MITFKVPTVKGEGEEYKLNSQRLLTSDLSVSAKKAQHCFGILDREGVFELQYIHETRTHLKIKCSPTEAQRQR